MNDIFRLLNPSNTVTVNRPLAHAIGLNEAIVYGALISKWHYYSEHGMLDDGWFYSTAADLEESTALTERQQKRCTDNLAELGLIKCEKRQMPAKRGFYIVDDVSILEKYIADGERKMNKIKPQKAAKMQDKMRRRDRKKAEESTLEPAPLPCSDKTSEQVPAKCGNKSGQNVDTCSDKTSEQLFIKSKDNRSKDNNPINKSIPRTRGDSDGYDMIDLQAEREAYSSILKENIGYDYLCELNKDNKNKIDELLAIMLDVVCSTKPTVRVNGEELPKELVKSKFLKLDEGHIDYVLYALKNNSTDVRNIRSYLITALYNAPSTIDSYYTSRVNHDLKRKNQ